MATTERNGLLQYVDSGGNMNLLYPITKAELVDGLDIPVQSVNGQTGDVVINAVSLAVVPLTRRINGYMLTGDVTLTASDVGAAEPETWNDKPVLEKILNCGAFTGSAKNVDTGIPIANYTIVRYDPYVITYNYGAAQPLTLLDEADVEITNSLDGTAVSSNYVAKVAAYNGSGVTVVKNVTVLIKYTAK